MNLFISTKKIISRALISIGITTVSLTSVISAANGTTLARSQSSLKFTNFSHAPEQISPFQSAFAYISTTNDFAILKSDPMYVTGVPVLFHPLAPQFPALLTSTPEGNSVVAPFQLESVTGNVFGQNNFSHLSGISLGSGSNFSVNNTDHYILAVGQAGININFLLQPGEKLSFDFQSFSQLEALANWSSTAEVEETQVIYFFTQPAAADVEINNGILMFSIYPQLHLSANNSNIEVDLLELTTNSTSQGTYSRIVSYNGTSEGALSYFNLSTPQKAGDALKGSFEYTATRSTILTAVAYTSSVAASFGSTKIPESSTAFSLIYLSLIFIGAKLVGLLRI